MLEDFNKNAMCMVSPLIVSKAHRLCSLPCVFGTKASTSFLYLLRLVHRKEKRPERTKNVFQLAPKAMNEFGSGIQQEFLEYQHSVIGTLKFPLFKHLTEDLQTVESPEYLHVGLDEGTYKQFKKAQ